MKQSRLFTLFLLITISVLLSSCARFGGGPKPRIPLLGPERLVIPLR
jgi:hypothetical protein